MSAGVELRRGSGTSGLLGATGAEAREPSATAAGWRVGEEARPAAFCCDLHNHADHVGVLCHLACTCN